MIFRRSSPSAPAPLVRGAVVLRGDLSCNAPGSVEGRIEGMVHSTAELNILSGGDIRGSVRAAGLHIQGRIHGGIICRGDATLAAGAEVRGPLKAAGLEIEEGARYEGGLTIGPEA
jgi:cytoskeletal protein CcmA (bactofilin family)